MMATVSRLPIETAAVRPDEILAPPVGPTADESFCRYMQGEVPPATSSVLTSNSKYLNSPNYRDAFCHQALRRHGHDLPPTYNVPPMYRAIAEVTDQMEAARMIAAEKEKNPEFAHWVDVETRRNTVYRIEDLRDKADGTFGAALRTFLERGYDMAYGREDRELTTDLDFILRRRGLSHDIEHIVTGFGPNTAGEQALAMSIIVASARYFSPDLAHYLSHHMAFVACGGLMRTTLHYHDTVPTYYDAVRQGIALGQAVKRPLWMERWEDYLDWQLGDLAAHLGFEPGPGDDWHWTTEAASG
jgi:ubiquinone biosynthesis protein Coq4